MNSDLAWAAGLFEGDGCISKTNTNSVRLDLAMHKRDLDVLRKFKRIVGCGKLYGPYKNNMVFWLVFGREVSCSVLLNLYPYLGKRRQGKVKELFPRFRYSRNRVSSARPS